MRIITIFLALSFGAAAQIPLTMGLPVSQSTSTTCTTNAAANWCGFMWKQKGAKTLSKVRLYMAALTGTVSSGNLQLDVYAMSGGLPTGSSLATATSTVAGAANTWQEWTGFSLSLSADTHYYYVVQNLQGTPASNFVTFRYLTGINHAPVGGRILENTVATTTASGSPWTGVSNATPVMRLEYSDATFAGFVVEFVTNTPLSNYRVYGTRSWGFRFTAPANASAKVTGCYFGGITKVSSPTGVQAKLYSVSTGGGTATSVATSASYAAADYSTATSGYVEFRFSSAYDLTAGGDYICALETTNTSDSSSNYTNGSTGAVENVSGSLGLMPFSGTMRGIYCTGTCGTWSNWTVVPEIPVAGLVLDFSTPFASTGGSSAGCSYVFVK